jgi:hypothetical protein
MVSSRKFFGVFNLGQDFVWNLAHGMENILAIHGRFGMKGAGLLY